MRDLERQTTRRTKNFDRSFEAKNFQDKQVGAWRQTTEGRVSVAAIKGAMDKYDNQVFDKMAKKPNGIGGHHERWCQSKGLALWIENGKSYSDFKGNDQDALSYATVCYAAMASVHKTTVESSRREVVCLVAARQQSEATKAH